MLGEIAGKQGGVLPEIRLITQISALMPIHILRQRALNNDLPWAAQVAEHE